MSTITAAKRRHSLLTQTTSEYPVVSETKVWKGIVFGACIPLFIGLGIAAVYWLKPNNAVPPLPSPTLAAQPVVPTVRLNRPEIIFPELSISPRESADLQVMDLLALRQQQLAAQTVASIPAQVESPDAVISSTKPTQAEPVTEVVQDDLQSLFAEAVAATEDFDWQQASEQNFDSSPLLATVDEELAAQVPRLIFQSHIYSSDSEHRYVRLNDQRFQEGDWLSDNVELVAIRSDDIVLRVAGSFVRLQALRDWE